MTNPTIRAVAFDAVGTLIHPDPPAGEVYFAVAQRHGSRLTLDEIRTRFIAAFAEQERFDIAHGLATSEDRELHRWQTIVAQVLDDVRDPAGCFAELYDHFAHPIAWRCEPGTAPLLCRLRDAGCALAIASNYDHRLSPVIAGIAELAPIETVVISSEAGWRKPALPFFAHIAAALRLPPNRVLYVGDDFASDFEGGRQAGMPVILFDPHDRRPELAQNRIGVLAALRLPGV
jgi:putative hydrolase of the HAD superfamily